MENAQLIFRNSTGIRTTRTGPPRQRGLARRNDKRVVEKTERLGDASVGGREIRWNRTKLIEDRLPVDKNSMHTTPSDGDLMSGRLAELEK